MLCRLNIFFFNNRKHNCTRSMMILSGRVSCPNEDLNLSLTLSGGQSFRWNKISNNDKVEEWIGVMNGCLWSICQDDNHINYKLLGTLDQPVKNTPFYDDLLTTYFRLNVNLKICYNEWCEAHEHFKDAAASYPAIRVLSQEPIENLYSFMCSQNNHINRISAMVEKLCVLYGKKICSYQQTDYYAFPSLQELCVPSVENDLRAAKFGYRASYISNATKDIISKGGETWLNSLRILPYKDARKELIKISGIGPKVADCICLMSLGHLESVPVDTHIYNVARTHYIPHLRKTKSLTTKTYEEVGDVIRNTYGKYAGWAQTVLFCSDLRKFKKSAN